MPEITVIPARNKRGDIIRAAAYARVSSSSDDQLNSFNAQIKYYTELLKNSTNTVFVDMYADEGITGTSAAKRDEFQRLMNDCRKGKIDRILTKSVSRFARNTKDCLEAVRELKSLGVSVYFEKEKIDTGELSSEMLLTLYSQFAQEESMSISKNVRMGFRKRMQDGTYVPSSTPFGYIKGENGLEIDDPKAEVVQAVFSDFLHGASELNSQGIIEPVYFAARSQELDRNLVQLQNRLHSMLDGEDDDRLDNLRKLITVLEKAELITGFDEDKFGSIVEKITVLSENEIRFELVGGVGFNEQIQRKGR